MTSLTILSTLLAISVIFGFVMFITSDIHNFFKVSVITLLTGALGLTLVGIGLSFFGYAMIGISGFMLAEACYEFKNLRIQIN